MARKSSRALWTEHIKEGTSAKRLATPCAEHKTAFTGTILGIDPSLRGMGLALINVKSMGVFELLFSRTLKLNASLSFYDCLGDIAQEIETRVSENPPDHVSVEETIYVQNFRTAQIMGAARGAALAGITRRKIPVFEYAPLRIKQAVVGHGRASKEQVGGMVRSMLKLDSTLPLDESDAVAAALCHAFTYKG